MQLTKVIGASGTKKTEPLKRENTSKQAVLLHFCLPVPSPLEVSLGELALQRRHLLLHLLVLLQLTELDWWLWQGSDERRSSASQKQKPGGGFFREAQILQSSR